ncbi:TonB-dependent receptor [Sphingomonas sp. ZT3P38]|uniref:TonB-dependent receptor n=1 Tax=Parasphingomonas zepuensis TaxID=3096161 RepID=UPI002FC7D445
MKFFVMTTAALLASTSAYAQTEPTGQDAAATAVPADTASAEGPDIIVTAQKRSQSLQDVSAAVSAIGADRLQSAQVNNIQDLQTIVPSVNFGSDFNQAKIFIRGVGANTSTTGSSTGVAFHVDGAYVARAEAQLTSLFDVQRVEVLRGPQGALYGRNAVGGSINLITAKPTDFFEGYARLTYGNYNAINAEVAIGGPIVNGVSFRVSAKTEDRDGYGENPVSGRDIDDLNRRMGRVQLLFDIAPKTSLLLAGEYFRQDDSSGAIHYLRASFPGVARLAPLGVGGYATDPRDLATESSPGTKTETYAFTGTFRTELTSTLGITNIMNYRRFRSSLFQDLDLSAVVDSLPSNGQATTVQERRIDSKQFSNEFQINYNSDLMNAVVGLFYFNERQRPIDNVGLSNRNGMFQNIAVLQAAGVDLNTAYALCGYSPGTVNGTVIAPKRVCTHSNLGDETFAVFGQTEIKLGALSDALSGISIKLGGRWSTEKVDSENPAIVITRNGVGPVLQYTAAGTHRERTFKDFTPTAGLEWKPTRDLMLYYTYSEGFKAGSPENAAGSTTIVEPETITNHEVGVKAQPLRWLTVNLAGYSYSLDGLQLNKTIAGGPTGYQTIFQNAAKTKAKGFELEVNARPLDGLSLSSAVSYTDSHFVDYVTLDPLNPANVATPGGVPYDPITNNDPTAFGAPSGGNYQLAGNPTRNSPRWSWNAHAAYQIQTPALNGSITPSIDVSYKGKTYFSEFKRDIESANAYTLVDASLNYQLDSKNINFQIWVKNLTDKFRPSSTFALATGRLIGATWLPPRTFGATMGYKF